MKSCSFSVVHSIRHVSESDSPVVTLPRLVAASESTASIIWESLCGSDCVLRPRSWSAIRRRRWRLASTDGDCDWLMRDERVTLADLLRGREKLEMAGRERDHSWPRKLIPVESFPGGGGAAATATGASCSLRRELSEL
ncbi:HTH-type transcriptional regulator IscR [Striga asiatica]|uniref:HTH-type transcriptional regulator IscR n=1 Tax=Striga asiatica TaxID=4170 RepID=A0A5A7PE34_STRAF|nr:HTH-type transcriptional regulator IscR [Striga asiatica]